MRQSLKNLMLLAVLTSMALACGKKNPKDENANEADEDSASLVAESAVSVVSGAVNDSEQNTSYAVMSKPNPLAEIFYSTAQAASCGLSRFSPAISPTSSCVGTADNSTVLSSFDNCTVGKYDQYVLSGQVWLKFDAPATCDEWINGGALPTGGSVLRTSSAFVRHNPNGSYVTSTSDASVNYKGESVGGGIRTSFSPAGRSIDILGVNRVRTTRFGFKGFDHSLRTSAPIVVTGTIFGSQRSVQSGRIDVDHNRAKYTTSVEFNNLIWDASCCHPINGSVTLSSTLSEANLIVDFNTGECGLAKVTGPNGSQNVNLSVCE